MSGIPIDDSEGEMPEDFDPEAFSEALQDFRTGARKFCIRSNRCARNMTCEHAQQRQETAEVTDLFQGRSADFGDCSNWLARRELNTGLDVLRRPSGSGSRHNSHAKDRDTLHKELIQKIERGEAIPYSSHTPEELRNMLEESRRRKGKKP